MVNTTDIISVFRRAFLHFSRLIFICIKQNWRFCRLFTRCWICCHYCGSCICLAANKGVWRSLFPVWQVMSWADCWEFCWTWTNCETNHCTMHWLFLTVITTSSTVDLQCHFMTFKEVCYAPAIVKAIYVQ